MSRDASPGGPPEDGQLVERWARAKAAFLAALERPPEERSAFVATACAGDPGLLEEVRSLLAAEHEAGDFCEVPAAGLIGLEEGGREPPRLPPGTRLGAYEILSFLSAGGMGEVYRARHTVLKRTVAIKTVLANPAGHDAERRLLREARHASILHHPNICTIHEVGEAEGRPFIVMELIEGVSLAEAFRDGRRPLGTALELGMAVADALEHAHGHGIVHRDLKSSNVMLASDGRPVVLDFGLARRLPRERGGTATASTLTDDGRLAGTLSHMAPEVLLGMPADARSDVWSLGVLLYEMAAGELPFTGRTPFETSSAILSEPPRPMGRGVPLAVRLVIERCLVKDPARRYQRAADVRTALGAIRRRRAWPLVGRLVISARRRTLSAAGAALCLVAVLAVAAPRLRSLLAGPGGRIATLVFLPLENATGDPAADVYAAGLTEGLHGQLSGAAEVRVIAPGSAARAALAGAAPTELARRLEADAVLSGRLREASGRIAVDLRLVDGERGRVLWSDAFERDARQILVLQADAVRALTATVRLTLRPGSRERLATVRAVSPEAYEEYLRGRFEWNRRTPESLQRAIAHFTRATSLDPTYAPAYAALADCYNQLGTVMVGTGSPRQYRPLAASFAMRALRIDPLSAEAHAALGYVRHYDWRWAEAEESLRRAIALDPSSPLARIWYANLLMSLRRWDEALEQVFVARRLDPYSPVVNTNVAWVLTNAGRPGEAVPLLRQTLDLDSSYIQARHRLVAALTKSGQLGPAYQEAARLVEVTARAPNAVALLARMAAMQGRPEEARKLLGEVLARARTEYVPPFTIADLYAALGRTDSAMAWLARTVDERSNAVAYFAVHPYFDAAFRREPAFQALMARAGLR